VVFFSAKHPYRRRLLSNQSCSAADYRDTTLQETIQQKDRVISLLQIKSENMAKILGEEEALTGIKDMKNKYDARSM
jgi:hypothetical protein